MAGSRRGQKLAAWRAAGAGKSRHMAVGGRPAKNKYSQYMHFLKKYSRLSLTNQKTDV
jgi:hypothetical protein